MKVSLYGAICFITGALVERAITPPFSLYGVCFGLAAIGIMAVIGAVIEALIINRQWWGEDRYDQRD